MNFAGPRYAFVPTQYSLACPEQVEKEWIFNASEETYSVTQRYNGIVEEWEGLRGLTSELRKFLNRYPWHFEAMSRYAACKLGEGKALDGLAYAQTAVSLARSAFSPEFQEGTHRIPGGYVENRPFLRCLVQLMEAQAHIGDFAGATATGFQILSYDQEDRMGARMELPKFLLKQGRIRAAIELFEDPAFTGDFYTAGYLYPIALLHAGREAEARKAINDCLGKPRIAKYLLDPDLPPPEPENRPFFGITSGSELEGFYYAAEFREFWASHRKALPLLREQSTEAESQGWPAFLRRKPADG